MNDYDISSIFNEMQEYLIASMTRNLGQHEKWEQEEGFNWEAWQVLQLEALEDFKRSNKKYVNKNYNTLKLKLEELLKRTIQSATTKQEAEILKTIKNGFSTRKPTKAISSAFFRINDRKLKAIINATEKDLKKASSAMLRMADDEYRKTIYRAQVFANSGTITVDQAIDMATKDFLAKGINCIEYKNGRRVGIDTYAEMVIRNANKKAYLVGEGTKRDEWGIHTVLVSRYGACSPTCLPWQGKVYIDDVYSGGTAEEAEKTGYPLLSTAIAGGLFHPNCKHIITTYFEGITTIPKAVDVKKTRENSDLVATQRYNERQIRKYKRLENNSLDRDNQSKYKRKRLEWQVRNRQLIEKHPEMHRNYAREKVRFDDTVQELAKQKEILFEDNGDLDILNSFKRSDDLPKELILSKEVQEEIDKNFDELVSRSKQTGSECLAFADINTGKILGGFSSSKSKKYSEPTKEQLKVIDSAKDNTLFSLHTHPSNNPFSFSDIVTHNIVDPIGTSIVQTEDNFQYFFSTPKGSRIRFESDDEIVDFKRAAENQVINLAKDTGMAYSEAKHQILKTLSKSMGWQYGRKKR
ncbi:phage minor capsid protein [Thomasclavelia cocleata]|uniref:phage minor capsid protein n=1 Tax=Thomasclavelia cocleata TaxID=69824 RepID=UPI00272D32FF|nr:phage minor capsid protein [Thomasclavelia cocleata]